MKKLILFSAIVFAIAFVSCSKNEGDVSVSAQNIEGRWEVYKSYYNENREIEWDYEYGEEYGYRNIYQFNDDGTGSWTESYKNQKGEWQEHNYEFSFTLEDKILYIKYYREYPEKARIVNLSAKELVIDFDYEDEVEGYERFYMKRI